MQSIDETERDTNDSQETPLVQRFGEETGFTIFIILSLLILAIGIAVFFYLLTTSWFISWNIP